MSLLFIHLRAANLSASRDFYSALGFSINEPFSDEQTLAVVVDDNIAVMLHRPESFSTLIAGEPSGTPTVINCLTAESREEVDTLVAAALGAGGQSWLPAQSGPSRYTGSFADPDGNAWQIMWMEPVHVID